MKKNIIYEKHYPQMDTEDIRQLCGVYAKDDDGTEKLVLEQIIEKIYKDVSYVELPARQANKKFFYLR